MKTYGELVDEYVKLFVLVIETVGQEVGNKTFESISEVLMTEENIKALKELKDREPQMTVLVSILCAALMARAHESSREKFIKDKLLLQSYVDELWNRYLKVPTNKFMRKNGLPTIVNLSDAGYVLLLK